MAAPPKLLSRKPNGTSVEGPTLSETPKPLKTKTPTQGDKVVVRRLPPGMTEEEFVTILGDEWKVGNGKVDWFSYAPGKISTHPSKPSTPARAYLHVIQRDQLTNLVQAVQAAKWEDAKESYNDPALISAPVAEFAIYKKIPTGNKRVDNRQGTIDQDPEFMAFLESLANPDATKEGTDTAEQTADDIAKAEKTTTTPLIEYLKEKRAAKAKELAAAKSLKHGRQESQSQGSKGKTAAAVAPEEPKKRTREGRSERERDRDRDRERDKERAVEKAPEKPKELIKILSKRAAAATEAAAEAARTVAAQVKQSAQQNTPATPSDSSNRRKGGISVAAKMLQRDLLGLSSNSNPRRSRQEAAKDTKEAKGGPAKDTPAKENVPAASVPAPPARPAESSSLANAPKGQQQQNASGSASGRSRNRRRGGGGEEAGKGKAESSKAEKTVEKPAPAPVVAKPPVILLKKKDSQPAAQSQSQRGSTPATPSTPAPPAPTPAPASVSTAAAPPAAPSAPKAATQKQGGSRKSIAASGSSSGSTRAFIKHANHSQGVTEVLLRETLSVYGTVNSIDIDRKKGFAYVEFADRESLTKAMAASPIAVAQATVQVLERRENTGRGRNGGGGSGQGQGQGQGKNATATTSAPAAAAAAAASSSQGPPPPTPSGPSSGIPAAASATEKSAGDQAAPKRKRQHRGRGGGNRDPKEGGKDKDGGGGSGSASAPAATNAA
ncbi:Smg-4/UPF3 family-domain-containing protein [Podospora fimiseda]|uniref:Smg-4/UPF3 family-domain-containing protein n=1 Tax=Podospora fimiseda TaxID=252190 RepID=A0AAN7BGZ9_9PEZI|nr:Smg-4/UPF3 family-domain-containing protein [Podospora fimiseda]